MKGDRKGLRIEPQLPDLWNEVKITRFFRGAVFNIKMKRIPEISKMEIYVDKQVLEKALIEHIIKGKKYEVLVHIPE